MPIDEEDTTTFVPDPDLFDVEPDPQNDPKGAFPGMPALRATAVWRCRQCGYSPVDEKTGVCYNCGRNYIGEDVGVPDARDKPSRPQVRSDGVT